MRITIRAMCQKRNKLGEQILHCRSELSKICPANECKRSSQLRTLLKRVVENRTWKKFRPVRDLSSRPLWFRCNALPTELTSQLGAGQYVESKYTIHIYIYEIHIFALRWRNECKKSSQLRTLLKRVVENRILVQSIRAKIQDANSKLFKHLHQIKSQKLDQLFGP